MEEAERMNKKKKTQMNPNPFDKFSIQLSGQPDSVVSSSSSPTYTPTNNHSYIFVLALSLPCNYTRIRGSHSSKSVQNHSALVCNHNVGRRKSKNLSVVDVVYENCGVSRVVSPYFSRKGGNFIEEKKGNDDGGGVRGCVVVKCKKRKRVRANVGVSSVESRGGEEKGVGGKCCGVDGGDDSFLERDSSRIEVEENCECVGEVEKEEGADFRKNNVALKGKRSNRKRGNVGVSDVLGVDSRGEAVRGFEGEQNVGERNVLSRVSAVKLEECECLAEEDADFKRIDVPLKEKKKTKRRRENVGASEVLGVESRGVVKRGSERSWVMEEHVGEWDLSNKVSTVELMDKSDSLVEEEGDFRRADVTMKGKKKTKRRSESFETSEVLAVGLRGAVNQGNEECCSVEGSEKHVGERNSSSTTSMIKLERKHERLREENDTHVKRKIVALKGKRSMRRRKNVVNANIWGVGAEKMEFVGRCNGLERNEDNLGVENGMNQVKHAEKYEDLRQDKESGKNILGSRIIVDENPRVDSANFVKADNGHGGTVCDIVKKSRKKRKKKQENVQVGDEIEMDASHIVSRVVSPYFHKEEVDDLGKSKTLEARKRARKQGGGKKKRISDGAEKMETKKKLKDKGKSKDGRVHGSSRSEENDEYRTSSLGSQVEKERKYVRNLNRDTVASATGGLVDRINHIEDTALIGVKSGNVITVKEIYCESYVKSQEATSPCSKNARKKLVKAVNINKDDQTSWGDECNMMLNRNNKSKKKNKKSISKHLPAAEQEAVLESSSLGDSKEDCIHENQGCFQASAAKKASPYFQKSLDDEDYEDERYYLNCKNGSKKKSVDGTAIEEFDRLFSRFAYKSDCTMNGDVDNFDKDRMTDQVNGSAGRKKQRQNLRNRPLTPAEKLAEAYRRKVPDNLWKPPSSPFNLLQEDHAHDPWRVLVICMLLNITTGPQVRKEVSLFFQRWPNAEAAVHANVIEIAAVIQSLGLHRKRAAMIQRFSQEYLSDDWTHVTQLHGIGKYAADAYAIFCNGMWDQVTPNDHMLNYYWKYLQRQRSRELWKT